MAGVRFADVQSRPAEFLNLTSLTLEEFQVLVAPFEAAFQDHMAAWRLDGRPRTARRFTVYRTCPLATPQDRLVWGFRVKLVFVPSVPFSCFSLVLFRHDTEFTPLRGNGAAPWDWR